MLEGKVKRSYISYTHNIFDSDDKVEELRRGALGLGEDNVFTQRYLPTLQKDPNLNLDDLGKP